MPKISPLSRADFVRKLRKVGFDGPFSGGKHQYMKKGKFRLTIPNPHGKQIDSVLIKEVLKQAGIEAKEWLNG